jgi:hypothetical protein
MVLRRYACCVVDAQTMARLIDGSSVLVVNTRPGVSCRRADMDKSSECREGHVVRNC